MKIFNEYRNQIYDITDKIIRRITDKDIFRSRRIQNLNDFYIIHRGLLKAINPNLITKDPVNILKAFELSSNNNVDIADDIMNECKKLIKIKSCILFNSIIKNLLLKLLKGVKKYRTSSRNCTKLIC